MKALSKREGWLLGKVDSYKVIFFLASSVLKVVTCNTHLFNLKWYFGPLQGKVFPRARPQADDGIKRVADVSLQT